MTLICPQCREEFNPQNDHRRKFCGNDCRIQSQKDERLHRLAEFKWIAGTDSWENIAQRIGMANVKAMREWVRAAGEIAWAERIAEECSDRPRQGRWAA